MYSCIYVGLALVLIVSKEHDVYLVSILDIEGSRGLLAAHTFAVKTEPEQPQA